MQRANVVDDLVWQRQQFCAERIDHLAVCLFELRSVDELPAPLSQFEQLQFARDALSLGAFSHQIDAILAAIASGEAAQVIDVRQSDLLHRCGTPVDFEPVHLAGDSLLADPEMCRNGSLSWHLYNPLDGHVSTKNTGFELPVNALFSRGPRLPAGYRVATIRTQRKAAADQRALPSALARAFRISSTAVSSNTVSAVSKNGRRGAYSGGAFASISTGLIAQP